MIDDIMLYFMFLCLSHPLLHTFVVIFHSSYISKICALLSTFDDFIKVGLDYILDVVMKSLTLPALKSILSYPILSYLISPYLILSYCLIDWMETFEG